MARSVEFRFVCAEVQGAATATQAGLSYVIQLPGPARAASLISAVLARGAVLGRPRRGEASGSKFAGSGPEQKNPGQARPGLAAAARYSATPLLRYPASTHQAGCGAPVSLPSAEVSQGVSWGARSRAAACSHA